MVNTRTDADLSAAVQTPCRHCFPRFAQRFARSSVPVLDSQMLMVNTRTDAELLAAVQNALQTLLPQIRAEIREEFRTGSGQLDSGRNPPPFTIHTWLERFNKTHSRLDWLCISLRVMHLLGGKPISKSKERLKKEYHSIRQTDTENSTEFMQRFLQLVGFLGAAAGTAKEQAKNFQWGLRRLNFLISVVAAASCD
nr:hypothetical protein [Tanacetum cinerariifolium]